MSSKMTGRRWGWGWRQGCVLKTAPGAHRGLAWHRPLSVLLFLKDQYHGVHDNTADSSSSFPRLYMPTLQEAAGTSSSA